MYESLTSDQSILFEFDFVSHEWFVLCGYRSFLEDMVGNRSEQLLFGLFDSL